MWYFPMSGILGGSCMRRCSAKWIGGCRIFDPERQSATGPGELAGPGWLECISATPATHSLAAKQERSGRDRRLQRPAGFGACRVQRANELTVALVQRDGHAAALDLLCRDDLALQ